MEKGGCQRTRIARVIFVEGDTIVGHLHVRGLVKKEAHKKLEDAWFVQKNQVSPRPPNL